jgi:hypothetical protein
LFSRKGTEPTKGAAMIRSMTAFVLAQVIDKMRAQIRTME